MSGFDTRTSSVNQDNLILTAYQNVSEGGTILSGLTLARGTIVGKITTGGKLVAWDVALSNGAEIPYGVLLDTTDASAADKVAAISVSGTFAEEKLIVGGATDLTTDANQKLLRAINIYTKNLIDIQARVSD